MVIINRKNIEHNTPTNRLIAAEHEPGPRATSIIFMPCRAMHAEQYLPYEDPCRQT